MTPDTATLMAEYNRWMNQRLYVAALRLPTSETTKDRGAFFGSLLQTLTHIAVADTLWLHRFAQQRDAADLRAGLAGFPVPTSLDQALAPSVEALQVYRVALDDVIVRWAHALTEQQLSESLHYKNTAGAVQAKRLGPLVQHFFNHQTHHRGQASTLLHQAGVDVGVTDLNALIPNEA
jgi:uncharacterized damage-inducible protein DinB